MEQITEVIMQGAISILVILLGIIFNNLREFLISKSTELQTRTTSEQFSLAQNIAITVVHAVEQVFRHVDGAERFKQAQQLLIDELRVRGVQLTDEQLKVLIESAVNEMSATREVLLDELTRSA